MAGPRVSQFSFSIDPAQLVVLLPLSQKVMAQGPLQGLYELCLEWWLPTSGLWATWPIRESRSSPLNIRTKIALNQHFVSSGSQAAAVNEEKFNIKKMYLVAEHWYRVILRC